MSLPSIKLSVPAYYVIAPAEASSNLSRFDGVRFGHRCDDPQDLEDLYKRSRSEGFGDEVKRRILVGAYALSAGYYDAYYRRAQQVRRLIRDDFARAFEKVDVLMGPTAPETAFKLGAKKDDPVSMYMADVFTIGVNLAGLPACPCPPVLSTACPPAPRSSATISVKGKFSTWRTNISRPLTGIKSASVWRCTMSWEVVIGLEVHVQLNTVSKLFSGSKLSTGAAQHPGFLVDLGLPGTLPVVNREAVRKAALFGLAINADICRHSVFERKNYFYPDLPKGYQTTQLAEPVVGAGIVEIVLENGDKKSVRIHHAHLEEDAGKSLHEAFFDEKGHGMTGIDLNRAGTPLIEIVSEPDMSNAEEAVAFARKLHAIVTSIGICSGDMSQGNMRFDVNSIRKPGEELGTRTETKNLNSFRFMEKPSRWK